MPLPKTPTEAAVIRAERDALRLLLRAIYDQTMESLEPDEDDTVTCIRRGRGHTEEEGWRDALRTIRDRIDKLLPWATETGESYEETWLRLGYRVEWSEQQPRAYAVCKVGCCPSDGNCLVRLRTVREVDEWIRRSGRRGSQP